MTHISIIVHERDGPDGSSKDTGFNVGYFVMLWR